MSAIRFADIFFRKNLLCRAKSHESLIDENNAVEIIGHSRQIMVYNKQRFTLLCQRLQKLNDLFLRGDVYPYKRLVEQPYICLLAQCPRQEHPLLLPARKGAYLAVAERLDAQFLQCRHCLGMIIGRKSLKYPLVRITPHQRHIVYRCRKRPVDIAFLGQVDHLLPLLLYRAAMDTHLSGRIAL